MVNGGQIKPPSSRHKVEPCAVESERLSSFELFFSVSSIARIVAYIAMVSASR